MAGIHVKFDTSPEEFLSALTEAAYKVGLRHGFKSSFVDYKMEVYSALYEIIQEKMQVSPMCGSCKSGVCTEAPRFTPWTQEAEALFSENKEEK